MKLYKTKNWEFSIDTVESERQTDKSVFINGGRNAWSSDYTSYFKTYDEAKEHLVSLAIDKYQKAEIAMKVANERLIKANNL